LTAKAVGRDGVDPGGGDVDDVGPEPTVTFQAKARGAVKDDGRGDLADLDVAIMNDLLCVHARLAREDVALLVVPIF